MKRQLLALLLVCCVTLQAADWPHFRGAQGSGASAETSVPATLNLIQTLDWQVNLPGQGLSSPVIVGDRVFVTCSSGFRQQTLHVLCFRASDGDKLWERQFWATGRTMCHEKTSVAAPSPASDGQHIVAIFSSSDIACLDLEGNLVWFRGLGRDYPNASNSLGLSSSLVIAGGVVVAQVENQSESFVAGLDLETGLNRWKLDRPRKPNWTSPVLLKQAGKELVALQSSQGVTVIEPATGRTVWEYSAGSSSVPSSTVGGRILYVPSQGITALQVGEGKELPKPLWRSAQLRPGTPSPVLSGERLFTLNDGGVLTCANAASGERLWQLRLKGPFSSTPVSAGPFIYCVNEKGVAQVVDSTKPEGEVVCELDLAEKFLSTPAIAGGAIYLRGNTRLWKFGKS